MRQVLAGLLVGALVAPSVASAATSETMSMCQAFVDAWHTAYNKKDADAVAGMYDKSTGTYSNAFWTASGREALTQAFAQEMGMGVQMTAIQCDDSKQIEDIVFSRGTYSATGPGPDGKPMAMTGHWMATAVQRGKDYFVLSHNANLQMPPAK